VKEQSHKDEMSKALRGDFERLRDRGVATTLAPRDEQHAQPTPDERETFEVPEPEVSRPEAEPEPVIDAPVAEVEEPRPGWFGRLLGR
jgi:hypothetical protein